MHVALQRLNAKWLWRFSCKHIRDISSVEAEKHAAGAWLQIADVQQG